MNTQLTLNFKGVELMEQLEKDPVTEEVRENVSLVPSSGDDIMVFARTPDEMATAQGALISWADRKIGKLYAELKNAEENLAAARAAKIRTQSWSREVKKWQREINYYEKVHVALSEGYFIVPDFPINIVGVRTTQTTSCDVGTHTWRGGASRQPHEELPEGEGDYVDPSPPERATFVDKANNDGSVSSVKKYTAEAATLRSMDFPFRLIKPHLLGDLKKAMGKRIFDAIGVLPDTRRARDPMVVGVIETKGKRMLFLISWWIPTETL